MYEIQRTGNMVIAKKGNLPKFNASVDSYLIYKEWDTNKVSKVGSLTDEQLLLAPANAVELQSMAPVA